MIDADLKPYLIEVNHAPSFWTDSPLDLHVKRNLIMDSLHLIRVSALAKKRYFDMRVNQQIESRSHFHRRKKYGANHANLLLDEDDGLAAQLQNDEAARELFEWEEANKGAYVRIYPSEDDPLHYDQFLLAAQHDPRNYPAEGDDLSHHHHQRSPDPGPSSPPFDPHNKINKHFRISNNHRPIQSTDSKPSYQNHHPHQQHASPKQLRAHTIHENTNDDEEDYDQAIANAQNRNNYI